MGVCYSIQYKGIKVTAKVYMKHGLLVFFVFFFTVKPTLLNINILHPKVSAVPSASASPGPHALSIYSQSVLDLVQNYCFHFYPQRFLHQVCL